MLRALASLLAPPFCGVCGGPAAVGERVCPRCRAAIADAGPQRFVIAGLEAVAAARHDGAARGLVSKLKFSGRLALAEVAAEAMVAAWQPSGAEVLVPVPGSPARTRWRGFDTAALLATAVASDAGLPVARCLVRTDGPRQVGRSRAHRIAEPPVVRTVEPGRLPAGPIWIVDDVATTGATIRACSTALAQAGARPAGALTFARADSLGASATAS